MPRLGRVNLAGLTVAAVAAPTVTWMVMMCGASAAVGATLPHEGVNGYVFIVFVFFLIYGLFAAILMGTVGAGLMLSPFLLAAETLATNRPRYRKLLIIGCAAASGLAVNSLGLLLSPYQSGPANVLSYVMGLWIWAGVYRAHSGPVGGLILVMAAPVIGGAVAGFAYNGVTKAKERGLTEAAPEAI